ncbi:MAG: putative zinc-binding peptidase [Gemmataceae bacterium]|nr:putative zinc-binding peptidase [Gemmataceae bacterium]
MKVFRCDHCRQLVFFENVRCVSCGHTLAFLPDLGVVGSLDPAGGDRWTNPLPRAGGRAYRLCHNYTTHDVCNWAVPADDPHALCQSCRLTTVIPNLSREGNKAAWFKIEVAKRRLVYTLLALRLPPAARADDPAGLAFEFLADPDDPARPRVLTGHAGGVITVNIAEADDATREQVRNQFHEPYRTLLGHFRHESGHYYWDRLVRDTPRLDAFRAVFGDERADYAEALRRHHDGGPPADWAARFVSAYASAHPWEDWAETWAHYLHVVDALETASACGVRLLPPRAGDPAVRAIPNPLGDGPEPFDVLIESWFPVTYLLNNLNRGLGLPDAYPFVLTPAAVRKLRFVHDTVAETRRPA